MTTNTGTIAPTVHYKKNGAATFDVPIEKIFSYLKSDKHYYQVFKSYRLKSLTGNVVTIAAEVFNPDGSTFNTMMTIKLNPPKGIEATMDGGPFSGAKFVHTYTPIGDKIRVDIDGDFPAFPGISEADELKMIDGFFTQALSEDAANLKTWE